MKIFYTENGITTPAAMILPPVYMDEQGEHALETRGDGVYRDGAHEVTLSVEHRGENLFYVHRLWKNISRTEQRFAAVFRLRPLFTPEKYLIPCVSINGNPYGNGGEPKGMERGGERWIFAYDRESIPACTVTENSALCCAMFASPETEASLEASCSVWKMGEDWVQEILHPVIESPLTYTDRDTYGPAVHGRITLAPGESFSCGIYIVVSVPRWKNYGVCALLDAAPGIFGDNGNLRIPDADAMWDNSIAFAKSLITEYQGKKGFVIGFLPDGTGEFVYRGDHCFELGWCGQNVLLSRMLIEDYLRRGNRDSLESALEILDTRVKYCTAKSGLLAAQLRDYADLDSAVSDTCNMGYGAYELFRVWNRLKEIGIEKPEYLAAAKGLCDFFCRHYSPRFGFGKAWRHDGVCVDEGGTVGAFVIPALAAAYAFTGEEKYLDTANQALRFYAERDLDNFCCTAGALDTCCVDKETAIPFVIAGVLLYRQTGKEIYIEYARKAAYYITAWMFHYQPVYRETDDISRHGVCVKGFTAVSAQHHHLDKYAALAVPYLRELAGITGDALWNTRAEMMERAVMQFVGDGKLTVHGKVRPRGSQNEAVFHCNWGFGENARGSMNDWLVAWPCAFRLSLLAEKQAEGVSAG